MRALDGTKICGSRVRVEISHGKSKKDKHRSRYKESSSRYDLK